MLLVGGGVMVLEFGSRQSTRDLDGVLINSMDASKLRAYAAHVAVERGWPVDWLNDGAKGYLSGVPILSPVFQSRGIKVSRPSFEQLLAMKLCAWRDDVDIADARRLLDELPHDRDRAWRMVEPFLQPGRELKAKYAFDDLWETR